MQTGVWISLAIYFVAMIGIGFYAFRKSTGNSEEYMLGGRNLPPAVAALSAGASDMSGWLLLGLPGALYAAGLVEAWIGVGLFIGALINWIVVAPRLREQTERYDNALTIPEFLSNRFPTQATALRMVSAIIIVIFFAVYTASGLVAGGKLFVDGVRRRLPDRRVADLGHRARLHGDRRLPRGVPDRLRAGLHHDAGADRHARRRALRGRRRRLCAGEPDLVGPARLHAVLVERQHDAHRLAVADGMGARLLRPAAHHRALHGSQERSARSRPRATSPWPGWPSR